MTIRVEMHGEFPSYIEKCFGTTAEILAHVPTVRMAEGFSSDGGGQGTWVAENGTWVGFTNAPGTPSAPFASTAERTAAGPFRPNTVAWVVASPIPTAYMLKNGAVGTADADWQELSGGGSSAVAYGDLT